MNKLETIIRKEMDKIEKEYTRHHGYAMRFHDDSGSESMVEANKHAREWQKLDDLLHKAGLPRHKPKDD